jgi:hypothetical protein
MVLALVVGGCAAAPSRPAMWRGDVRFSESERAAIREGEAWIAAQGGHEPGGVDFDYEPGATIEARTIRRERGPGGTGECLAGAVFLGLDGHPATNEPPLRSELLPGLTAHEMAHCRYGFVDAYRAVDVPSDGIMRVLSPMRWTASEEAQCEATRCRDEGL